MPTGRVTLAEIRASLTRRVVCGNDSADGVAGDLACSQSTLHRALRQSGTTFTRERNDFRASAALDLLLRGTYPRAVAQRIGISPDYLRIVVRRSTGLTPAHIYNARWLGIVLTRTPETRAELEKWIQADADLQTIVGDLPRDHCLANWAKQLLLAGYQPRFHTKEFQKQLRLNEKERRVRRRHRHDAHWVTVSDRDAPAGRATWT